MSCCSRFESANQKRGHWLPKCSNVRRSMLTWLVLHPPLPPLHPSPNLHSFMCPCVRLRLVGLVFNASRFLRKDFSWSSHTIDLKMAGHIAGMKDNRWTKRCTEWQPRRGKRSRERPSERWQDDITEKEGTTWIRKATDRRQWKTLMEGYILQWMDLEVDEDEVIPVT